jgi:sulfur-oxidizing protein SoxY
MKRREVVWLGVGAVLTVVAVPARATPEALAAALKAFAGNAPLREGRMAIDIAPLVENGNTVPVSVSVQSPMTAADHVRRIALFTERNPLPEVVVFHLGPHNGRATAATRMRLATSQKIVAVAELSDGSYWQSGVEVIVTLAACIEGG